MKNLLILLIAFVAIVAANAQITQDPQNSESIDQSLGYGTNASYLYYNGQAFDTLGSGDSVWTYTVRVKSKFKLQPECYAILDSVGGTNAAVTLNLYSKAFAADNYTRRETTTWISGADTTKIMRSDSAHISEFWLFEFKSINDGFRVKLDEFLIKFAEDR